METSIGAIYNEIGGLNVKAENGNYYWSIEDYNGTHWEQIPEYLYGALMKFEESNQLARKEAEIARLQAEIDQLSNG